MKGHEKKNMSSGNLQNDMKNHLYPMMSECVGFHIYNNHTTNGQYQLTIPVMRQSVLVGTHILFSSVIPLDMRPDASETWRIAVLFGAKCYTELNPRITHVVAAKVSFITSSSSVIK